MRYIRNQADSDGGCRVELTCFLFIRRPVIISIRSGRAGELVHPENMIIKKGESFGAYLGRLKSQR